MAFDSSFISELKFRCPVDEVIGGRLTLKRAGGRYVANCPFHNEKTPSFTVFPDTASYYCFGCGAGGDVITFVMNYDNLDYAEAVRLLADRAGLSVPENGGGDSGAKKRRDRMLEMHRLAARHYYKNLMNAPNPGADYVMARGLTQSSVTRYGLGYAKDSFDDIKSMLLEQGFSIQEMFDAGLLAKSQKNGSYYDKFRDRLMFPVVDLRGNVIAFSGRALGDAKPKYMNSPDTVIYTKGEVVFGLNLAKDKNEGTLILCEGNIDVVMLSQAGFVNAVAPLGTAFTTDQSRIIAKYAKTVVVAFDSDAPGQKATGKAIDYLRSQGVSVRVLQMQGAKDPDEYIKAYGKERFATLISKSKTPTEYRMDILKTGVDLSDTAQKMEYLSKCSEVIAELASPVEREIYSGILARELDVTPSLLLADIERRNRQRLKTEVKKAVERETRGSVSAGNVNREAMHNVRAARAEETLIVILARNPSLLSHITERISPDDFVTDFNRRVFAFYIDGLKSDSSVSELSPSECFSPEETSRISFLLNTAVLSNDIERQADDCCDTIKSEKNKKQDIGELSADELARMIKEKK